MTHNHIDCSTTACYQDGDTHITSTFIVREVDEDEVEMDVRQQGSPMAGMLTVPSTDYDVSDAESDILTGMEDTEDEKWFPSLTNTSWIQELDPSGNDDDLTMVDKTVETLFATDIFEHHDDLDNVNVNIPTRIDQAQVKYRPPIKARKTTGGSATTTVKDNDDCIYTCDTVAVKETLVPVDVIYEVLHE